MKEDEAPRGVMATPIRPLPAGPRARRLASTRAIVIGLGVLLAVNLLILAGQTIPRGGTLTVDAIGDGEIQGFRVTAAGLNARIPQAIPGLVSGEAGLAAIDAHAIQPFYTGLLARSCGLSVALVPDGDRIVITAG